MTPLETPEEPDQTSSTIDGPVPAQDAPETPIRQVPSRAIEFVDTVAGLAAAVNALKESSGPFAVDAERASGFRYGQSAYLVQVARFDTDIFLIDPTAFSTGDSHLLFAEFAQVLRSAPWILHAASQDLTCLAEIGLTPTELLDTELGSRILGLERVGLGFVCESQLGFKLAKEHSAVDWSTRPLPADWLNYAALDVDVLFELWQSVSNELIANNKMDWAKAEFENVRTMLPKPAKIDRWRSMTGLHEIKDAKTLTIAKHLWQAREDLAKRLDTAPGRLIPDSSIIAALKANPKGKAELAALRSFTGRASRNYIDTWWQAISIGASTRDLVDVKIRSVGIPNHRIWPNRFPEAAHRLSACKVVVSETAAEHNLPNENLLTPDHLRQICFEQIDNLSVEAVENALLAAGARSWQVALLARPLANALQIAKSSYVPQDSEKPGNSGS